VVQPSDINVTFFSREPSFSLIYFAGLTHDAMPELLVRCGYSIIGEAQHNAPFREVLNAIEVFEGPRNNIVHKAVYRISGGRVLLDPEMVVAFFHQRSLRDCAPSIAPTRLSRSGNACRRLWLRSTSTPVACLQRSF
jgi:hypothetical protein